MNYWFTGDSPRGLSNNTKRSYLHTLELGLYTMRCKSKPSKDSVNLFFSCLCCTKIWWGMSSTCQQKVLKCKQYETQWLSSLHLCHGKPFIFQIKVSILCGNVTAHSDIASLIPGSDKNRHSGTASSCNTVTYQGRVASALHLLGSKPSFFSIKQWNFVCFLLNFIQETVLFGQASCYQLGNSK